MSPSECLSDADAAAVHKEIYGARKGSTSQGVKISKKFVDHGDGGSPRDGMGEPMPQGKGCAGWARRERVMLQRGRVKLLSLRVKFGRPG